jgi:hypothetical protein
MSKSSGGLFSKLFTKPIPNPSIKLSIVVLELNNLPCFKPTEASFMLTSVEKSAVKLSYDTYKQESYTLRYLFAPKLIQAVCLFSLHYVSPFIFDD